MGVFNKDVLHLKLLPHREDVVMKNFIYSDTFLLIIITLRLTVSLYRLPCADQTESTLFLSLSTLPGR